jgi:tRNA(fMet)-specific endonuclease VapC
MKQHATITQAELEYGVACSGNQLARNRKALDAFLQEVPAAPFDGASHALSMGVTLVTNNVSDFAAYSELKVENWVGGH